MEKAKLKVWLTGRDPDREDLIRALEADGCEVTLGRLFTDTWHYTDDELAEKHKLTAPWVAKAAKRAIARKHKRSLS